MYDEIKDYQLTTDANTNKNIASSVDIFSQSSVNVSAGSYQLRTYTVQLNRSTRQYQLYINLSIDGDVWTALPYRDRKYTTTASISVNASQNGNDITINLYMVNTGGSSYTFPAMTVSIAKRDFVDEL